MDNKPEFLIQQASRCRRLAGQITDSELARTLLDLGEEYARQAEERAAGGEPERPVHSAH